MEIIISSNTSKPIYEQITSQIKAMIMSGELKTGDPIPSMRALAKSIHVSVITVQKAYEDLQRDGFIETTVGRAITMAKRKRDVPVLFWVSAEELELIHQKMQQYGTENLSAYLRKMALDGYVVKLELPEMKELVSLMRRSSNNLNQLTRKVHETGRVYNADLEDISQRQEQLWEGVKEILTQLSKLS